MSAKPTYEDLQERISELEKEVSLCRHIQKAVWSERRQVMALLDGFPAYVFGETPDHSICYANQYFRERFGDPAGRRCMDFFAEIGGSRSGCTAPLIAEEMRSRTWEWHDGPQGRAYRVYACPFGADQSGTPLVLELGIDITSRLPSLREHLMLLEELQHTCAEMRGMQKVVPICSCCRQPRNDELHREQIADYIRSHSGPFAFDLCPECRQKHGPPSDS